MMEPTPLNMSKEKFRRRVERNGAIVKPISNAEYEKANKAYWKEYDNRPDYEAGTGMADNRDARRNARRVKINNRTSKKHRTMNV